MYKTPPSLWWCVTEFGNHWAALLSWYNTIVSMQIQIVKRNQFRQIVCQQFQATSTLSEGCYSLSTGLSMSKGKARSHLAHSVCVLNRLVILVNDVFQTTVQEQEELYHPSQWLQWPFISKSFSCANSLTIKPGRYCTSCRCQWWVITVSMLVRVDISWHYGIVHC